MSAGKRERCDGGGAGDVLGNTEPCEEGRVLDPHARNPQLRLEVLRREIDVFDGVDTPSVWSRSRFQSWLSGSISTNRTLPDAWLAQRQQVETSAKQGDLAHTAIKGRLPSILAKPVTAGKVGAHALQVRKVYSLPVALCDLRRPWRRSIAVRTCLRGPSDRRTG